MSLTEGKRIDAVRLDVDPAAVADLLLGVFVFGIVSRRVLSEDDVRGIVATVMRGVCATTELGRA
ncbi:hypothetical protein [Microbacterium sp.]|uniref:hypothetical protein n=1 Tax=Microbacterium sp. TaxID=51671 RepID=UPI0039E578F6